MKCVLCNIYIKGKIYFGTKDILPFCSDDHRRIYNNAVMRAKGEKFKIMRKNKCVCCKNIENLHYHHVTEHLLIVLCRGCHQKLHAYIKYMEKL